MFIILNYIFNTNGWLVLPKAKTGDITVKVNWTYLQNFTNSVKNARKHIYVGGNVKLSKSPQTRKAYYK